MLNNQLRKKEVTQQSRAAFQAFRSVRSKCAQGQRGVLKDDLIGVRLARVEPKIRILSRQQVKQSRGGAVNVGGLADITELADVIW